MKMLPLRAKLFIKFHANTVTTANTGVCPASR